MKDVQHIFIILVILNCVQGISCLDELYGLITASVITGVLLCVLIVLAVLFAFWPNYKRRSQLEKGKCKIPRSYLDYERKAKYAQKQRFKQEMKFQMQQKRFEMKTLNGVHDMELQYVPRSRPEIPGSWRGEAPHTNGYIVSEASTPQRTNKLSGNGNVVWLQDQSPSERRYSDITNASTVIRIKPPCDMESSSLSSSDSADSTLKVSDKRRSKSAKHEDDVVIEATLEFRDEDEGIVYVDGNDVQETVDGNEVQETITSF